MTRYVIFFLIFFFSLNTFAQETECFKKCAHAHLTSRISQPDYYQFSSMDKYDVKYLKLNLAVEAGSTFISGTALTVAKVLQPLDSFNIELKGNMVVDSVFVNGIRRNFQQAADHVFIPLSPLLAAGTEVRVLYYYKGTAGYGVYVGITSTSGLTYTATVSESYQARAWFPVKQILKDKIDSTDIWIKTSATNKVGSNGKLVAVVDSPGNKKQYQWKSRHPMNYYMPSIAVGNYRQYINYARPLAIAPDSIMVLNYIADNESYFQSVKPNLDKTPAFIEKYSELFTLYPFSDEKYGHAQANIGGGMEHQTMTTASSFGSTLIAHELTHQWWGDNVTCARWNDIWLNEGFATYGEYLAVEKLPGLFPTTSPAPYMQNIHNSVLSQPGGSVYIPEASVYDENRIFSGRLSYNKGAAIIHNLRFEMQDDTVFFNTLKNYQVQFGDSVATGEDFKNVAEVTSGRDFSDFFNQWYYGEGYPTFNVTYIKQGTDSIILIVNQMTSMPFITTFFKGLYEFKITSPQGDTTVKAYMNVNNQFFKFKYNKIPNGIVVDPNNWVLNTTGTITNGGVIPVKLLSFSGNVNNNCVAGLKWSSENEQDNKQYDIELSANGIDFSTIGTVRSHNSMALSSYEYSHNVQGKNVIYFRLKMVDVDGGFAYSQVLPLVSTCRGLFSFSINPNPVREKMIMKVNLPTAGQVLVSIFTSTGALVFKKEIQMRQGSNEMGIDDIRSFLPGSYFIRLENSNEVLNKKFIKW